MKNELDAITIESGYGFAPTLRAELARQPWLTDDERIAAAVEAIGMSQYLRQLEEAQDASFDEGKDEGIAESDAAHRDTIDDLRATLTSAAELFRELRNFVSDDQRDVIDDLLTEIDDRREA